MKSNYEQRTGPVPFEKHYELFKSVEDRLKKRLDELDHEYYPIGLRVAYDEEQSASEPGAMPYSVEFGYLGPLEAALECHEKETQLEAEELEREARNAPIPISLLDELYDHVRATLEELAGKPLRVGVYIVLTGSATLGYSADCPCPNKKKRYCYYDKKAKRNRCYCTTRGCGNS